MIKNYLLIAFRNLMKRKVYSFINIFGLAIGVAVCMVILKYVDFELSYDQYHKNTANIYRTITTFKLNGEERGTSPLSGYAQGPALLSDVPEVKAYVRTHPMYGGAVLSYKREGGDAATFRESNIQFVDSTFFDVFTYTAIKGNLATALDEPNSIVITKKMAEKYFPKGEDALGKIMKVSGGWADGDYEVTAVIDDIPANSSLFFEFLFPTHNLLKGGQYQQDDGWGWNNFVSYVELHNGTKAEALAPKFAQLIDKYRGKDLAESGGQLILKLQPLKDIHLQPGFNNESSATISGNTIFFFALISIFILAIAWVNYINLSTARAMERAREVGIKKAIGAFRTQLIGQFALESVLVNFIGVALAMLLAILLLPVLGEIVGKELKFDFADHRLWVVLFALFFVGSFISGAYPAFVLSSFPTIAVLKGKTDKVTGGFSLRKALVVFQFASSLILIAGTFTIYRQIVFMRDQDKGLSMDQMLIFDGPSVIGEGSPKERLISLKNSIRQIPGVRAVATSASIPGGGYNWGTGMRKEGAQRDENKSGSVVWVDPDFVNAYDIKVLTGRNFNPEIKSDMESVLVNEASLEAFNLGTPEQALEQRIVLGGDTVAILAVLKNYHWNSLKAEHSPWLLKADTISARNFSVKLSTSNLNAAIKQIETLYKEAFPGNPFDFYFLDDFFDRQYKGEQQFVQIFSLFAALAIIIACLGLWGLASFTTTQKLKEIGIRKVLGASVNSIVTLLSWQFFKLVLIASVISVPLTWYGIHEWLDTFAFKIGIGWELFVIPVLILTVLALGTVSLQIMRGASINPAKILRTE